jgi:hypothetical protein
MMEAVRTNEPSENFTVTKGRYNPEDSKLQDGATSLMQLIPLAFYRFKRLGVCLRAKVIHSEHLL